MYNEGISVAGSILDVATDMGIVQEERRVVQPWR